MKIVLLSGLLFVSKVFAGENCLIKEVQLVTAGGWDEGRAVVRSSIHADSFSTCVDAGKRLLGHQVVGPYRFVKRALGKMGGHIHRAEPKAVFTTQKVVLRFRDELSGQKVFIKFKSNE